HLCAGWKLKHRVATGALAAIEELRAANREGNAIDLVILDHHMPDIDGLGLAALALADHSFPRPTFVLLTSRGERLLQSEMEAHGLAACELKPVHPERLRRTLAKALLHTRATLTQTPMKVVPDAENLLPEQPGAAILVAEDNIVNQKVTLLQ